MISKKECRNCKIRQYETDKTIFEVQHDFSHEILFAISLAQAYKIARLLDLDYELYQIYEKDSA
jgi:hypothetical protein